MQLLISLRLSHLSPSHWKPRCLYGPVTLVTHSLKASNQGVSLPQPGPDRHNLNSSFAICWVEASSVNAQWRKKRPQRRKAAPFSPVLPSLWSSQTAHTSIPSSSTAPSRNLILTEYRSSCSCLLLSSQPVSPCFVQFDSSYLTENGKQVLQCLDRMDESPFPKEA